MADMVALYATIVNKKLRAVETLFQNKYALLF